MVRHVICCFPKKIDFSLYDSNWCMKDFEFWDHPDSMKEDISYCISLNNKHKVMFREQNTSPTASIPILHHPKLYCVCARVDTYMKTQHRVGAHGYTHMNIQRCVGAHGYMRVKTQHRMSAHVDMHIEHSASRGCLRGHPHERSTPCGCPHGNACQHSWVIHVRTHGALQGCRSSISLPKLLFWLELCSPNKIFWNPNPRTYESDLICKYQFLPFSPYSCIFLKLTFCRAILWWQHFPPVSFLLLIHLFPFSAHIWFLGSSSLPYS